MPQFLDLPNEIIHEIVQHVSPSDIESLAWTCARVKKVAANVLETHRALMRKHGVYRFCSDRIRRRCDLSSLVNQILREPWTAVYVQKIILDRLARSWFEHPNEKYLRSGPTKDLLPFCEQDMSKLRNTVEKCIPSEDWDAIWVQPLENGDEDPILALLLLLLPNLATLTFETTENAFTNSKQLHERVIHRVATKQMSGTPLSHLRHAQVSRLKLLSIAASLPSMKSIHGFEIKVDDVDAETWPDGSTFPKADLTDLVFTECSINSKRVVSFLKDFRALQSFTYNPSYESETDFRNGQEKLNPRCLISGLFIYASSTLRSLTLHGRYSRLQEPLRSLHRERVTVTGNHRLQ